MTATVLIVEDQLPMRELLKTMLIGFASVVGECADGAEALTAYRRLRPDWILMDVELPHLDGIAATRQIVGDDPQARIVIVTNHNDALLKKAARDAGACRYVLKEDLDDLMNILTGE